MPTLPSLQLCCYGRVRITTDAGQQQQQQQQLSHVLYFFVVVTAETFFDWVECVNWLYAVGERQGAEYSGTLGDRRTSHPSPYVFSEHFMPHFHTFKHISPFLSLINLKASYDAILPNNPSSQIFCLSTDGNITAKIDNNWTQCVN